MVEKYGSPNEARAENELRLSISTKLFSHGRFIRGNAFLKPICNADHSVFRESSRGAFFKKAASRTYLGGLSNVPFPGLTFGERRCTINEPTGGEMI